MRFWGPKKSLGTDYFEAHGLKNRLIIFREIIRNKKSLIDINWSCLKTLIV